MIFFLLENQDRKYFTCCCSIFVAQKMNEKDYAFRYQKLMLKTTAKMVVHTLANSFSIHYLS